MMKRLFNTALLLFIATLFVNAQNGSVGKFVTVFQKNGHEATTSTDGISFIKDEQAKRYAWQPMEWQKSDYSALGEAFDIKNVKSIFRSVESDNHFTVTIPAGAPVDKNEIIVQAYGKEITTTDGSQYTTGANAISVVNKDGNILYDCYASVDTLDAQRTIELNALETAYTLLLPVFPGVFEPTSDEILEILKSLLAELPETHALASAIDQSIVKNGYLDINDVDTEYQAAIDCIIEKMGLRNNYLKSSMNNGAKRAAPSKKPYIVNGNGVYGYKLVMNSSEWVENDLAKTWICNLTAYNSNRFAYTAWVRGYKDSEGGIHYYDYSYDLLRKSLLKPQRVSTFMGTFTDPVTKPFKRDSWDGILDYYRDSYKLFFEEGFGFDDMTWDNTKKTFDMSFFTSNDVVIVAGPAENNLMMYYNVLKTIIDPIIKKVAKKLTGAEDEDYMLNFCIELAADEDYRSDFADIFMSNKTYAVKAKEILILTWPKMRKYLDEFFYEQVKTKSLQYIWDHWGFMAAGELQKALDNIDGTEASWNKWLKTVEKVGDVTLGVIGLTEGSYYYDVALDFDETIQQKLIKVEPTEIDFGVVPVGTSKTEHFTVSNVGTSSLTFRLSEHHSDIDIPESGKEFTLAAGESKTFDVIFTPTDPNGGSGSAVRVFSDAENGTQFVTIAGQGAPAELPCAIKVEPTEIDFGTVPQGTSKTEYFTVTNIGQGDLVFKIHEASEPFFISEAGVEHRLSAGQSKQFSVTYSGEYGPGTGGQALVTIDTNATNVEWGFGLSLKAEGAPAGSDVPSYTSCPDSHHPHLIDLGLPSGTKWACCNVGAEKPEDYGGYFSWGETTEKSRYYWDTYIHCDGSEETRHDIGKDIAGTQYDAATANWGSPWVMPNLEQMEELKNSSTSEWTTENGVNGRRFTGPNGASIFLPASGLRWYDYLSNAGSRGSYWSSTLYESYTYIALGLYFDSGLVYSGNSHRSSGRGVRPVRKN